MNRSGIIKKYFVRIVRVTVLALAVCLFVFAPSSVRAESSSKWIVTSYPDASGRQGMFYTIRNEASGALIVVDGGWSDNVPQVRDVIASYGNRVDAWILTHYHNDHVDAFNTIYGGLQGIKIRRIYAPPIDYGVYRKVAKAWDFPEYYKKFRSLTRDAGNLIYVQRNDEVRISGLTLTFYNTYDDDLLDVVGKSDLPNNASLVFKAQGKKESFLFLGDAHDGRLGRYLLDTYGDELQATYVQAGHHGNNSMPKSFYREIDPKGMIFDAPDWLMTDGGYTAKNLAVWCRKNGIQTFDYRTGPNSFVLK